MHNQEEKIKELEKLIKSHEKRLIGLETKVTQTLQMLNSIRRRQK